MCAALLSGRAQWPFLVQWVTLLSYYHCRRLGLATLKRMLPVSSALFLLGLAIILIPPTLPLTSTVQGSNRTISLIGNYYDYNYSKPSGANPPIPVAERDQVLIKLTSTDKPHQSAL